MEKENYIKAREFDINGDILNAIKYYKLAIGENENKEVYSNLVGMLVEIMFDYGMSSDLIIKQKITEADVIAFSKELELLLKDSISKFEMTNEFRFWKYYCETFYQGYNREELMSIIESDKDNLIPYFYLYINDKDSARVGYRDKILNLKDYVSVENTHRNIYINSFLK